MKLPSTSILLALAGLLLVAQVQAHNGRHASVHDTVAGIVERLKRERSQQELVDLTLPQLESLLTLAEREVLGSEHLRFRVNVPVVVTILRDVSLGGEPFWLRDRGFVATGLERELRSRKFDAWEKSFAAGEVGLGVPSLTGKGVHYLVLVRARQPGETVKISDLYPGHLRVAPFVAGVQPFVRENVDLAEVPRELEGQWLIRTDPAGTEAAKLVSIFSRTQFPSGARPDHAVLTWSSDPRTTQTVQWRTSTRTRQTYLRYQQADRAGQKPRVQRARREVLATPTLINDPVIHRHTVTLTRLQPGTVYRYSIGDGSAEGWTEWMEFTTAPAGATPFSFVYMGDAQNGLETWGQLLGKAHRARPDAAFYLMAGDLVNRGAERWDWDSFFQHSGDVFQRRPIVPVIGNHECQGGAPRLYLAQFALPRNGPRGLTPERAYVLDYSNARFVILDSNLDFASQTNWLERCLSESRATWKFVSYHHPAYSASPNRDNTRLRELWTPIFDKYGVDLALQGHDHSYLRTYPMRGDRRVAHARDGTIYIVSVSGTKFYDQAPHEYTEVGFTKLSTYQVLDIEIQGNRLRYRAHDVDGVVRDEFVIEK